MAEQPRFIEEIICLANSRKHSGRCIAGKRVSNGTWIRPIGTGLGHEITEDDRRYQNGASAQIFDVIKIPCDALHPVNFQPENVVIDNRFYWESIRRASWQEILAQVDQGADLWVNGYSAYNNRNNRIPEDSIDPNAGSLRLIFVEEAILHAGPKAPEFNNMKFIVRASFSYMGQPYKMDVTDPILERLCMQRGTNEYHVGPAVICISLSELHNGYAYKLVASILTENGGIDG